MNRTLVIGRMKHSLTQDAKVMCRILRSGVHTMRWIVTFM
jgi:hypothetical protein